MTALYFRVLLECLLKASIVPFFNDTTYFAMKDFANFPMLPAFIMAVSGAVIGQFINWCVGQFLLHLRDDGTLRFSPKHYQPLQRFFRGWGKYVLLLSWVPLFNLLTVVAGFANLRVQTGLLLIFIGQAVYYFCAWYGLHPHF